jgi:hypothetical protein
VMFPDTAVRPVKEELGPDPAGQFSAALCRLGLRGMNGGRPLVALADHDPRIIPKLDVHGGILSHILHVLSVKPANSTLASCSSPFLYPQASLPNTPPSNY